MGLVTSVISFSSFYRSPGWLKMRFALIDNNFIEQWQSHDFLAL